MQDLFNKKHSQKTINNNAQGTIEYLVIIAVIIVIGLVVVSLAMNLYDTEQLTKNKDKLSQITSSINVVDALNYSGETIINLKNTAEGNITLTRISVDNETQEYDKTIIQGNNELITLDNLCKCEKNQTKKTCEIEIHYTTQHNLPKKITQKITINCEENAKPNKPPTPPIITNCFNIEDNPIQICTLQDLNNIRTKLNGNYILMKNIDATDTKNWNDGNGWEPIGNSITKFNGTFNGNNKTITNLFIKRDTTNIGLFGYSGVGTNISNLNLIDLNIVGKKQIGGVVGQSDGIIISNINVSGEITGTHYVGGLIGSSLGSSLIIENSFNQSIIKITNQSVGGLIGVNNTQLTIITNSGNFGKISGGPNGFDIGGLVGKSQYIQITNSFNQANIEGSTSIGGLIGNANGILINNSYNSGDINGIHNFSYNIGGIVGMNMGWGINPDQYKIKNSYNTGIVSGHNKIGGIVGAISQGHTIINTYNSGDIIAIHKSGMLPHTIGGLVGENEGSKIEKSYNIGLVTSSNNTGGIIGENFTDLDSESNVYWDTQITNQLNCYSYSETDSNIGCIPTFNQKEVYYGENGIPFNNLNWLTSIWLPVEGSNPILNWQIE